MKYPSALLWLALSASTAAPVLGQQPGGRSELLPIAFKNVPSGVLPPTGPEARDRPFHSNVSLNEINVHAFRHFTRDFPDVQGAYWNKTIAEYIVSFKYQGFREEVHYKLNGDLEYSVRYFPGEELEDDLKYALQTRFPGYTLDASMLISDREVSIYLINIHNNERVKTIQFCEGRWETVQDFQNGSQ